MRRCLVFFLLLVSTPQIAAEIVRKSVVLRGASIRASEVNVRKGPGIQYPIVWVLLCPGFPVKIVAEFGMWRKIQDSLGTEGWVHKNMLSSKKTLCLQYQQTLYASPSSQARALATLGQKSVLEYLKSEEKAEGRWHYVKIGKLKGFVPADSCWGLDDFSAFGNSASVEGANKLNPHGH